MYYVGKLHYFFEVGKYTIGFSVLLLLFGF